MQTELTDEQKRRYARNISLPGMGEAGQLALLSAGVLVVGAGGLGSASLSYLAAAGVGRIGIVDADRVEMSNLQRQILYETADIGRMKAQAAKDRLEEMNPDARVTMYPERLTAENAASLVRDYDLVADGCDNFATRFAVADVCRQERRPLISAAIRGFSGQLAVFTPYLEGDHACYGCLVSAAPDDERGCQDIGVLGAVTGVMGSLQALEVIQWITGSEERLRDHLLLYEAGSQRLRKVRITRDPACPRCGLAKTG